MKKLFFLMMVVVVAVFGAETWEAIVPPNASFFMFGNEKVVEKNKQNKINEDKKDKFDKIDEFLGIDEENSEHYDALKELLEELDKSPAFKEGNCRTFRLCDNFEAKKNVALAVEFKEAIPFDDLKVIPDAKLTITVDKIAGKDALSLETQGEKKARFALIMADGGKTMLLTGWDNAAAMATRIGKAAKYTAEMKNLVGAYKGDFCVCMALTPKMKQRLNEKAMGQMSVEPVQAMLLMKLAEMNGILMDSTIMQEGMTIRLGLVSSSTQAATAVKEQLFDGMVMPMAQNLADGVAPGKIKTSSMLKSSVSGKIAFLNISLTKSEIDLFKGVIE
ncbi:MAG: hypothetical protein IJS08_00075 [Victivallales bacterium]|nr:hypothetical protein [Victivallales bacterium]